MITVTTPGTSFDLTTLATVKQELGITDSSKDARLLTLIHQASGIVAEHCGRVFAFETVEETFRLDRFQSELILARYPVVEIESITEDATTLAASDYETDKAKGIVTRLRNTAPSHWSCSTAIVASYSAGFELLDDLPWGIERACLQLVKTYYSGRDASIRSESVDGISTMSYFTAEHLSPEIIGLLRGHRNYRPR